MLSVGQMIDTQTDNSIIIPFFSFILN